MQQLVCVVSGHRPDRFHFGSDENHADCLKIKKLMREWIQLLITRGVAIFYSGFAHGVDLWFAEIVLALKKQHPHITLHAAIPFKAQANSWTLEQRKLYHDLLAQCDHVTTLHEKYTRACYFERNRYMVDCSDYLLAVYDGTNNGGTFYTVNYSQKKNRNIIIIHPDTLEITTTFKP